MRRAASTLTLLTVFALGCDRADSGAKADAKADAKSEVKAEAEPEPPVAEPPKDGKTRAAEARAAAKKLDADEARASRASLIKLLNDGRKAIKAKRYDEGISLYREALAIDPDNSKVLGELGYAALKQAKLDLAESSTLRAIDLTMPGERGLGALYYNLGTIERTRGNMAAARTAFERSLSVRPGNKTVVDALAGLSLEPGYKGPAEAEGLCQALMREWECFASEAEIEALPPGRIEDPGLCTCAVERAPAEGTGESFIEGAAILQLTGTAGGGFGWIEDSHLAIETKGEGWQLVEQLINGYTPGVGGINNQGSVDSIEFVDLAPGPGQELLIRTSASELDGDMGSNTIEFYDFERALVCYRTGDAAGACASFEVSMANGIEALIEDEPVDGDVELGETRWKLALEFADGKVTAAVPPGEDHGALPADRAGWVGSRPFAEAVALAGVKITPLH